MTLKPGDSVYIWPGIKATIEGITKDGRFGLVWTDHKLEVRRKVVDETKILGKAS